MGARGTVTAVITKSYAIRAAGPPSRLGKVWKVYPYDLRSLVLALDEVKWRSITSGPHVLTVVKGHHSTVIRRFEGGHQVLPAPRG